LLAVAALQQESVVFWHEEMWAAVVHVVTFWYAASNKVSNTASFSIAALEPLDYCGVWSFK